MERSRPLYTESMKETLDAIGLRCGTDKSSIYHNYLSRIEPYLDAQPRPLRFLEIGVLEGRSIRMWLEYFPESEIFGIDLYGCHSINDPRFTFYQGDATSRGLWSALGTFNVIVDDGNHNLEQVVAAYGYGFNHLLPGGIWIIEDTCRSDYNVLSMMLPTIAELQDHNRDWCGDPNRDSGRFSFVHFYKGLVIIGRR